MAENKNNPGKMPKCGQKKRAKKRAWKHGEKGSTEE
jgi:hypothetical protein